VRADLFANVAAMKRRDLLAAALAAVPASLAAQRAAPLAALDLKVEYSADSLVGELDKARIGKLWRKRNAIRHEMQDGGAPAMVLVRLDRHLGWIRPTPMKFLIETDLTAFDLPEDVLSGGGGVKETRLERERMNGMETTKYRLERRSADGASFEGFVWATVQGVVGRVEGTGEARGRRGRTVIDFHNARIGTLDPALFEPPADLQLIRVKGADVARLIESLDALSNLGRRR
jgi:hypothetical protein